MPGRASASPSAPTSDVTTPRWRSGRPPGSASSVEMNAGKLAFSFSVLSCVDGESSTMTSTSTLRLTVAGIYFMGVDDETARRVNVGGTRTVLELARDAARLERVVHWSTAM